MPVTSPHLAHDLVSIATPVAADCAQVEALLREQFSEPAPWMEPLFSDRALFGGKRLRPLLLLLSGASFGSLRQRHHRLALSVEMIHLATLIHDDLIDGAVMRRQAPTVNHRCGAASSVLLGDWLYAQAFVVAAQSGAPAAVATLARSIRAVCEGEIRQHYCQGNLAISLDDYLEMIDGKTAALCAAACEIGALASQASDEWCRAMAEFGRHVGIAFQIVDDILDLIGSPEAMGKTLQTDLTNRRMTAPLIFALQAEPPALRLHIQQLLAQGTPDLQSIVALIEETGAVEAAWNLAHSHRRRAQDLAARIPHTTTSVSLSKLAEFVTARHF